MHKNKRIVIGTILIIVVAGLIWQGVVKKSSLPAVSGPVKIGAVLPLTGPGASIGNAFKEGIEWKVDELKKEGWNIELFIEDSQTNPVQAVTAFNMLTQVKGVKIVISTVSGATMALKPLADEQGVLLMAAIAHPDATKGSEFVVRYSNTADADAKVIADHIAQKGYKKVAILAMQDDWGKALGENIRLNLEQHNIAVIYEGIDNKASDFKTPLTKVKAQNPDAMVFATFGPSAGIIIKEARQLGYKGQLYSSNGFVLTANAEELAGDAAKGMYFLTYVKNEKFKADYKARFGKEMPIMGIWGYPTVEIITDAIAKTKSTDPKIIAGYIKGEGEFNGTYGLSAVTPQGDILIPTVIEQY